MIKSCEEINVSSNDLPKADVSVGYNNEGNQKTKAIVTSCINIVAFILVFNYL